MDRLKVYTEQVNIMTSVLEDDTDLVKDLQKLFTANGFHNCTFFDSGKALIDGTRENIHVCVIDYYLQNGMNGLQVMKEILSANPYCYVIAISGQQDYKVVKDFLNNGAYAYVDKNDKDYVDQLVSFVQRAITKIKAEIDFFASVERKKIKADERTSLL